MLQFHPAAVSHVGLVRSNNEDSGFAGPYLLLIADGVGGAAAGEVASATTAYVASALSMVSTRPGSPTDLLAAAIGQAASQLRDGVLADPNRSGMGTTLTALYTDGRRVALGQVGDSRAYLLRGGALRQLTTDHTLVQALVDAGQLTAEQARTSSHRNIVLRSLGAEHDPEPDISWLEVEPGDRLLLCSDGLSDLVDDRAIATLLAVPRCQDAVERLVAAALAAGGRDNVTCIAADVVDGPPIDSRGLLVGAVVDMGQVLDPTAVR